MSAIPANPFPTSDGAALAQALDILHTHIPAFNRPAGTQLTPSQTLARQLVPQAFAKLQALADSPLPSIALRACQTILHFASPTRIPLRRRTHPGAPLRGPGRERECGPERKRGRHPAVHTDSAAGPSPAQTGSPSAPATPQPPAVHSSRSENGDPRSKLPPFAPTLETATRPIPQRSETPPSIPRVRVFATTILLILSLLLLLRLVFLWALPPFLSPSTTIRPDATPPAAFPSCPSSPTPPELPPESPPEPPPEPSLPERTRPASEPGITGVIPGVIPGLFPGVIPGLPLGRNCRTILSDTHLPRGPPMYDKVLILSATAGAGHVRAAQAIEKAFALCGGAREVRHVDTLQYTNPLFRKFYADAYLSMCKRAPMVMGWLYDHMDTPFVDHKLARAFNKLNTGPFVDFLQDYRPDICICTHFLPSEIIAFLKAKRRVSCPLAIVVTDLDAHGMWLARDCDHYFLAMEETAEHLKALGVPPERLSITGIPIDPVFAEPKDRRSMRLKLGLAPDRTTILVTLGGFSVFPIENLVTVLARIQHPVQIVTICGHNTELQAKLTELAPGIAGSHPVHVVGFTTAMDEYMAAADILVGKPGGLTTSEALARGLILCIVNPIPGQEERNSDHLLEENAAIRCNNLPALPWKIDRLLDDPARMALIRANVARLAHPNSAQLIVQRLVDLRDDLEHQTRDNTRGRPLKRRFLHAMATSRRALRGKRRPVRT